MLLQVFSEFYGEEDAFELPGYCRGKKCWGTNQSTRRRHRNVHRGNRRWRLNDQSHRGPTFKFRGALSSKDDIFCIFKKTRVTMHFVQKK